MEVSRAPVPLEEMRFVKSPTPPKAVVERAIFGRISVTLQSRQVVASMKIVYPVVLRVFGVVPRTVTSLSRAGVAHRTLGHFQRLVVIGQRCKTREESRAHHVRVVDR